MKVPWNCSGSGKSAETPVLDPSSALPVRQGIYVAKTCGDGGRYRQPAVLEPRVTGARLDVVGADTRVGPHTGR